MTRQYTKTIRRKERHGMSKSAEYNTWHNMIKRCSDPSCKHYKHYGGRGITVCEEWRHSFTKFFEDMGQRPPGKSLDRIDVNGHYSKDNCRWATASEQASNRRPANPITFLGRTESSTCWSKELGYNWDGAVARELLRGHTMEEIYFKRKGVFFG